MTEPRGLLITGCFGFTGSALLKFFENRTEFSLSAMDVVEAPPGFSHPYLRCDLAVSSSVDKIEKFLDEHDVDIVVHCAALVPFNLGRQFSAAQLNAVNVQGTRYLLQASQTSNVSRLVIISSTGVVFCGKDIENGDESLAVQDGAQNDAYSISKAKAEKLVLQANSQSRCRTIALRPNGLWGVGEQHHFPKALKSAMMGASRFSLSNSARTDWTHVDNLCVAVDAAIASLDREPEVCAGQAYFIVDDERDTLHEMFLPVYKATKFVSEDARALPAPPAFIAFLFALLAQLVATLLQPAIACEPFLTTADVRKVTRHNYYTSARAKKELGYKPVITRAQGQAQMIADLRAKGWDGAVPTLPWQMWVAVPAALFMCFVVAFDCLSVVSRLLVAVSAAWAEPAAMAKQLLLWYAVSRPYFQCIFAAAMVAHFIEAAVVGTLAWRLHDNAMRWTVRTFVLGFGSSEQFVTKRYKDMGWTRPWIGRVFAACISSFAFPCAAFVLYYVYFGA